VAFCGVKVGVQLATVATGSAAYYAGLRVGDVLLTINAEPLPSFAELRRHLDAASPGDTMTLTLRRAQQEMTVTATLGEYRPTH